jgi:hypothetical protein
MKLFDRTPGSGYKGGAMKSCVSLARLAGCLGVLLLALTSTPALQSPSSTERLPQFHELFAPGGPIFRDRNGDQVVDFVDAHIALADNATVGEVIAAANVAARFGFETTELNLPLPTDGGHVAVAVGRGGLKRLALAADPPGMAGLLPGEGLVAIAGTPQRPVLVVAGRDDAGTRAAGDFVSARMPYAWDVKGATLEQVGRDVAAVLARADGCTAAGPSSVIVRSGGDSIERVLTHVSCGTLMQAQRCAAVLRGLRGTRAPAAAIRGAAAPSPRAASLSGSTQSAPVRTTPTLDYPGIRGLRFEMVAPGTLTRVVDVPRRTLPVAGPAPHRASAARDSLDLSNLYDIEGLLGDGDANLIPDRTDVLLVPDGPGTAGVTDVAARLALESAGASFPLVVPVTAIEKPDTEPTLMLIGLTHPLTAGLESAKVFERGSLAPGTGLIRVVPKAFGEKRAIVITGADEAGLQRALRHVAERLPYVWQRGKDRTTLNDIEEDLRLFLSGRSPAGQAALGLYKLDQLVLSLAKKDLASAVVRVYVDKPDASFEAFVRQQAAGQIKADTLTVHVEGLDVRSAVPAVANGQAISGEFDIPSEVEDFWTVFRTRVLPAVKKKAVVSVEARLSEPRALRETIAREARAELLRAGAAPSSSVVVLNAYKQGFSWLNEVVTPAIAGRGVTDVRIRFAEAVPPPEWKQQALLIPTRWLLELYPIDEILARNLKIDLSHVTFEKAPADSPTYEVVATNASGGVVYREVFDPRTIVRPYFDRFPDYEHVRVSTGWVSATVEGRPAVNQRITTDLERFWGVFQAKTLPTIYDFVMAQSQGKPRPEDAPHFGKLEVDVTLSEPHEWLDVDQERISPMEALHEDVYFSVLHFFDLLGRMNRGAPLDYPGHIVPIMRPVSTGKPGHARITFTGSAAPRPMVVVDYTERSGITGRISLDIPVIAVDRPAAMGAVLAPATDGIDRLDLRVKVDSDADEREALVVRARADRVDKQVISAAQVVWTVNALQRLRGAGLYRDALAYRGVREMSITAGWTFDPRADTQREVRLEANGVARPEPDIMTFLPAGADPASPGPPAVPWDRALSPSAAYAVMARMASHPEVTVYKAGESYLGQDVWAMDLTSPIRSSHWSQAKATTIKPTVIYSGRQHANEVSSTNHVLGLAESLITNPARRTLLDKVNVVIHPITNADGAQLADDLWRITPDYMLHAAYLGALGVDVTAAQWESDAIYPESKIRALLWRTWLPDIFADLHGYPSHEWVQPFSEYAAWVRTRVTESRDWWGTRGWFMPGFAFVDDPKYPRHQQAAFDIRRRIAAAINGIPDVKALNTRAYDRYRRYGFAWNREDFKLDFTDGVLIYSAVKGSRPNPRGNDPMLRQPNITIWSGATEAPDEPASGDWLTLVASAGLAWDNAVLTYLAEGKHDVERKRDPFWGGVTWSLNRPRPPKPEASK